MNLQCKHNYSIPRLNSVLFFLPDDTAVLHSTLPRYYIFTALDDCVASYTCR